MLGSVNGVRARTPLGASRPAQPASRPGRVARARPRSVRVAAQSPIDQQEKPAPAPAAAEELAPASVRLPWPKKRDWATVFLEKVADTVEDALLMAKRGAEAPARNAVDRLVSKGDGGLKLNKQDKPVVLVLGTGWGAHAAVKVIDTDQYEVVCVSPRNHFIFTPMLPSTAVGTIEFRSLLEPIRNSNPFATYFEATCDQIDHEKKIARCTSAVAFMDGRRPQFEIEYDTLVVAVGEQPATFGVPGVVDNAFFMKEITDAVKLRRRTQEVFELAALPGTSEEDRRRLLQFVVVGGGPTGVEFAGTFSDFLKADLSRKYPDLMPFVKVTLLQNAQSILTTFSAPLQAQAIRNFEATGIDVRLGVRVTAVERDFMTLKTKDGEEQKLPYGVCVWSTGNAARPMVRNLVASIPTQAELNKGANPASVKLAVDPYLRVIGARDIIALGDCSRLWGEPLPPTAQVAGQQGAYAARLINRGFQVNEGGLNVPPPIRVDPNASVSRTDVDAALRLQPIDIPRMAAQERLSELDIMAFNTNDSTFTQAPPGVEYYRKPFEFLSLGIMAYVGNEKALVSAEVLDSTFNIAGSLAFLLWRSVYITKQVSFRNRVLILFDWVKARVFGRDLSQF
ncbi:NADH dehydrogenase [Raphidocelis subcapitata]|uniref:NADH:ubiquinone reductase (non-electrogenic) n=1 Tax=Raphidocelis subcapitata TaxID=307507 RepID=A0A2V0PM05_9CHLO|nr:NADH dehydrogenase [Raphidocelis subcapitata]|eukprot:GBG00600.1 NADH dehydrogenase [Raphidocelis subcapitata]